jgi:hypothetical protein
MLLGNARVAVLVADGAALARTFTAVVTPVLGKRLLTVHMA